MDVSADASLREAEDIVTRFQREEILLLQAHRIDDWLKLLSKDIQYFMPTVENVDDKIDVGPLRGMVWADDDFNTLALKVKRINTGLAIESAAPTRLRYFVQNLSVGRSSADSIEVVSNVLIHRSRRDTQETFFVAGREDVLAREDGKWLLKRRTIHLDHSQRGTNSHQMVFF